MENNKMFQVGKLIYTTREDMSAEFAPVKEDAVKLTRPTLLIFGGNDTDTMQRASDYAKTARYWLPACDDSNQPIDIYSVAYTAFRPLKNDCGLYFPTTHDYQDFADTFFLPNLTHNGQRISLEEAKANMSKIAIFAHSAGGFVAENTLNSTRQSLLDIGYSADEITDIFSQIVLVAHSPYSFVTEPIQAVYICPFYDSLGSFAKAMEYITSQEDKYHTSVQHFKPMTFASHYLSNMAKGSFNPYWLDYPAVCVGNKNTIMIAPNKLRRFGNIPEDHGLSGIIHYPKKYNMPDQSAIGRATSEIIEYTYGQAFDGTRKNIVKSVFLLAKEKYNDLAISNTKGE